MDVVFLLFAHIFNRFLRIRDFPFFPDYRRPSDTSTSAQFFTINIDKQPVSRTNRYYWSITHRYVPLWASDELSELIILWWGGQIFYPDGRHVWAPTTVPVYVIFPTPLAEYENDQLADQLQDQLLDQLNLEFVPSTPPTPSRRTRSVSTQTQQR